MVPSATAALLIIDFKEFGLPSTSFHESTVGWKLANGMTVPAEKVASRVLNESLIAHRKGAKTHSVTSASKERIAFPRRFELIDKRFSIRR